MLFESGIIITECFDLVQYVYNIHMYDKSTEINIKVNVRINYIKANYNIKYKKKN